MNNLNPLELNEVIINVCFEGKKEAESKDPLRYAWELNNYRLISSFFANVIDDNSQMLYPEYAFTCRSAFLILLNVENILEGQTLEETSDGRWLVARNTYFLTRRTFDFFMIFPGTLISYDERLNDDPSVPSFNLTKGYDQENEPFMTGAIEYVTEDDKNRGLVTFKLTPQALEKTCASSGNSSIDDLYSKNINTMFHHLLKFGFYKFDSDTYILQCFDDLQRNKGLPVKNVALLSALEDMYG